MELKYIFALQTWNIFPTMNILRSEILESLIAEDISEEYQKWVSNMDDSQLIVLIKISVSEYILELKPNINLKDLYHE